MAEMTARAPAGGSPSPRRLRPPRIVWHLLGLALVAVLPFLALTAYLGIGLVTRETAEATAAVRRSAEANAKAVERVVSRARGVVRELAAREEVRSLDPDHCDSILGHVLRFNPEYSNVFTRDAEGRRVCSALPPRPEAPRAVDPRQYLEALRAGQAFVLGSPGRGGASGKWVVPAAKSIVRGRQFVGLAGVGIDLATLTAALDSGSLPGAGLVMIVDRKGTVITRDPYDESWIGSSVADSPPARLALQGRVGTLRTGGPRGSDRIWGFAPIAGTDWVLMSGMPSDAMLEGARANAAWILGIVAVIVLAVVLLAWALARRIAAPIEAMAAAAPFLGREGAQPLEPAGPAEAVALAEQLNRGHEQNVAMERRLRDERARLEGLVGSAMDAVVTVDAEYRIVVFNAAAERMFEFTAGEMLGEPLDRLIPERFRRGHPALMGRFAVSGTTNRQMGALGTVHGRRASGEEFPIEASISQVEVGGQRYLTAVVRDITQRLRAEQEVRNLNAQLEQRVAERTAELEAANQELAAFDYSISHDLRAPLARIQGFAAALREDCGERLDDQGRRFVERIEATGRDMDRLVHDMLELSLVGRREMERADVDLSAMAGSILEALQHEHPLRRAQIFVQPGMSAWADPGLVRIALENLVGNAWKFTSKRELARIDVGVAAIGGRHAFFVRDNGAGFDPAHAGRLFEPFRRLHAKSEFEGTGVGLATVHRIVRRHGGTAWARSFVDAGATFYFTLQAGGPLPPEDRTEVSGNP